MNLGETRRIRACRAMPQRHVHLDHVVGGFLRPGAGSGTELSRGNEVRFILRNPEFKALGEPGREVQPAAGAELPEVRRELERLWKGFTDLEPMFRKKSNYSLRLARIEWSAVCHEGEVVLLGTPEVVVGQAIKLTRQDYHHLVERVADAIAHTNMARLKAA